ncbi:hypothetical protein DEU56DRAFT_915147 [Suillus clintonianus]|uniref:uncharacterized protein n=1 Tax=Suillus clintonianus TaxID=1904413 RepID=UPI001B862062|nr:uncharacterized protein DEU56DRAFT_915147 [Suillus clintonianus]KAG2129431.1 hypothetical protein DEU56DRAFT_915147 [Suillus clintonianus]
MVDLAGSHTSFLLPPALLHTAHCCFYSSAAFTKATTALYNICLICLTQNPSTTVVSAPPARCLQHPASHLILQHLPQHAARTNLPPTLLSLPTTALYNPCPSESSLGDRTIQTSGLPPTNAPLSATRLRPQSHHLGIALFRYLVSHPPTLRSQLLAYTHRVIALSSSQLTTILPAPNLVSHPPTLCSQLLAYAHRVITWGSHYSDIKF